MFQRYFLKKYSSELFLIGDYDAAEKMTFWTEYASVICIFLEFQI